jgi:hypothetical protein
MVKMYSLLTGGHDTFVEPPSTVLAAGVARVQ